jgi:hypothetical protein
MGSFFKIFLRSFGQKLYIGLLRKFVSNSLSNEFFYDWQLIDSFTVEQITNG